MLLLSTSISKFQGVHYVCWLVQHPGSEMHLETRLLEGYLHRCYFINGSLMGQQTGGAYLATQQAWLWEHYN